jgi:hypothetical protein
MLSNYPTLFLKKWESRLKMDPREIECCGTEWIYLAEDRE